MSPTFVFRVNANPSVGTGHLMRCLALAQAMKENGCSTAFVAADLTPALQGRLAEEKAEVIRLTAESYGEEDAHETAEHAKRLGAAWVVVDGYRFDGTYQDALKREGLRVLFVDDYGHAKSYAADAVLNQNVGAKSDLYTKRGESTALLLGTQYALLQRQFREPPRGERQTPDVASRLLVTLGGGDPANVTCKVVAALRGMKGLEPTVVVGGANPHAEEILSLCRESGMKCIINAPRMRELMEQADMAVSAGGTTSYELAYLGVPTLSIILADNQVAVAEGMAAAGCSVSLGWHDKITQEKLRTQVQSLAKDQQRRELMAETGRALVDGYGADRVLMHLLGNPLRLRRARPEDAKLLWKWANDPQTRSASFSTDSISWERHQAWFAERLRDPGTMLLLAFDKEDDPVGYVRFETKEETFLSIAVAPDRRGQRHGTHILREGLRSFFQGNPNATVHAYVKEGNEASAALFLKGGFTEHPLDARKEDPRRHFTAQRGTLGA
ncbi:MAG: UDP-2,4-diacetamido-2,4,6-trideoxy-beta-L-altropyranose hydrolase [Candidatus Peribacteraceae bacterium]|jgi:UDP-2,4-diacetamido-2,4,6-trideoxy-beta-L-altropyranose hydrolase